MSEDLVQQVLKMMTEEQKAELISKLSKTDELRDVNKVRQETQAPKETRAPDDFTMTREKPKQNSTQVEVKKRENLFTDDGVEHKDEQNTTPQIPLTERKRPPVERFLRHALLAVKLQKYTLRIKEKTLFATNA